MKKHWNYDEARGMRAEGVSWDEIGRAFGVTSHTAHARTEPKYAAFRREQINARRRSASYPALSKRDHVRHVVPAIVSIEPPANRGEVFETPSGMLAYRKFMPNLVKLGEAMSAKGEGTDISLPWVSILAASERTA